MRLTTSLSLSLLMLFAFQASAQTLTLAECLDRASQHNRELQLAHFNVDLARDDVSLARSTYLPRLDLEAGYTRQNEPQALRFGGTEVPIQEDGYRFANASVTQPIYTFGRLGANYDRAQTLVSLADHEYQATRQTVFLQIVAAYYGVLEAEQLLSTASAEAAQMSDHLRVAKDFLAAGVTTEDDLLQAEVQLASSKHQQLSADNALANRWLVLNRLTCREADFRAELQILDDPGQALSSDGLQTALRDRPEIRAALERIRIADLTRTEAKAGYAPELFARLAADYVENNKAAENTILSATIGFRINLFDGLATSARNRKALTARAQAQAALTRLQDDIALEYRTASNDKTVALQRIDTTAAAIEQAVENLRITRERYQALVGTATEVVDAQTLLTRTKNDRSRALFDYHVAAARVEKAAGLLGTTSASQPTQNPSRSSP